MNLSSYLQNIIADWVRGTAFPAAPGSVQIGLSANDPLADGSGILEPTDVGYARKTITFAAPVVDGVSSSISNDTIITFGPVDSVTWASMAYIFVTDGTNLLFYGPMNSARSLPAGDTLPLAIGAVQLKMVDGFGMSVGTALLQWVRGNAMIAAPTNLFLALSLADPEYDLAGLDELSTGDGYERQEIFFAAQSYTPGEGTKLPMFDPVIFGPAEINPWGSITHGAILDQDDRLIAFGPFAAARTVDLGTAIALTPSNITLLIR